MSGTGVTAPSSSRLLTVPNAISLIRIALIPVFVALIVDRDSSGAPGIALFGAVVATDWVDGLIARRTGQVSDIGKVLDPLADRCAIGAGLIALVIRGAFPWWAAALVLVRDAAVLIVAAVALGRRSIRIEVRWIGKLATLSLMCGIPWIAWGTLELPLGEAALVCGWAAFVVGITESYAAAVAYLADLRRALTAA